MATQPVTSTDNGQGGVTLTTPAFGTADTSTTFVFPPCQQAYFNVQGTLTAGSLSLQVSFDGGTTWFDFAATTKVTAPTTNPVSFVPPGGALCRIITTGVTGAPVPAIGYAKSFI